MKRIAFILVFIIVFNTAGCKEAQTAPPSATEQPELTISEIQTTHDILNELYTPEERERLKKYIDDEVGFKHRWGVGASFPSYYTRSEPFDRLFEIELSGVALLHQIMLEECEKPKSDNSVSEPARGEVLAEYYNFGIAYLCRCPGRIFFWTGGTRAWTDYEYQLYAFICYAQEMLGQIYESDLTAKAKVSLYRDYGYFAIPYIQKEIERGGTGFEDFFILIGAHLNTAEYMKIVEKERTNYRVEGADECLRSRPETDGFDYKKWLPEIKDDLIGLLKYAKAYKLEKEAKYGVIETFEENRMSWQRIFIPDEDGKGCLESSKNILFNYINEQS